jgi:small subunit ribosomal protein S7
MKLFNKWEMENVIVEEEALKPYIYLPEVLIPRSAGNNARGQRIWSQKTHLVERLINKLMVPGHSKKNKHKRTSGRNTGKAMNAQNIVLKAFENIEKKIDKNPVQVFVKAVENACPREEVTGIEYGGARYAKAVEISPLRRVDVALRFMVWGAYAKSFNSKAKIADTLAAEILGCYRLDTNSSAALSKKLELERQADASR